MQKIPINIAVEDDLSEAVLKKILNNSGLYMIGTCLKRQGFGYLKRNVRGFNNAAKGKAFLLLTDLDKTECAPSLIQKWLPIPKHPNFLFRVAVREVESWVLASRSEFADFLKISKELIPIKPDEIYDPKQLLINLAKKSRNRELREAIVPKAGSTAKIGPDYNGSFAQFIADSWNINEAAQYSPSLKRTVNTIRQFKPK